MKRRRCPGCGRLVRASGGVIERHALPPHRRWASGDYFCGAAGLRLVPGKPVSWTRDPLQALDVECPKCGAPAGEPCEAMSQPREGHDRDGARIGFAAPLHGDGRTQFYVTLKRPHRERVAEAQRRQHGL